MRVALLLIIAILLQATGNLCLSLGMKEVAGTAAVHPISFSAIASPINVVGILFLIGFFCIFATTLARADLSVVVPIISFEIVLNVALAHLILHEAVSPLRWMGTILVTCGVGLVALSARRSSLPGD
jgi:uncharacterized membrane protein